MALLKAALFILFPASAQFGNFLLNIEFASQFIRKWSLKRFEIKNCREFMIISHII